MAGTKIKIDVMVSFVSSIFTKELYRYLFKLGFKSHTISIDDFHNPSKIRNKEKDPVISYLNNAFDITKIENEIMKHSAISL